LEPHEQYLWVQRRLREEYRVLLGGHAQLVIEGVVQKSLKVVEVGDYALLDRVFKGKAASLALCLITNIGVFLTHANHNTLVSSAAEYAGKYRARRVIACISRFDTVGAVVDDDSLHVFHRSRALRVYIVNTRRCSCCRKS
jgi:hypothetical protein